MWGGAFRKTHGYFVFKSGNYMKGNYRKPWRMLAEKRFLSRVFGNN